MTQTEDYKRELISILFAQKHLIFWVALAVFAGAVLVASFWPASYQASGEVLVSGKQLSAPNPEALESPSVMPREVSKEDLMSEMQILRSPEVISAALRYFDGGGDEIDPSAIHAVSSMLDVAMIPSSNVIKVRLRDKRPAFASEFVNTLMEQYIVHRARFFRGVPPGVSPELLQSQIDAYIEQLRRNEDRLLELVESSGVSSPKQEIENNIILKKKLEEALSRLEGDRIEKTATLRNLERATDEDDIKYYAFLGSGTIRELSAKLADLYSERGKAARTYLPESTVIINIDEQIEQTSAALKAEVMAFRRNMETELGAADEKIEKVRMAIAAYSELNVELQRQIIETGKVERDSALILTSLESLSQRKGEVELNWSMDVDDGTSRFVTILSRAITPVKAAFPKPGLIIPLGLIVGLLAGCTLGFIREYFDHSFKTPADVQMYTGLPVLFSLAKPQDSVLSLVYVTVISGLLFLVFGFLLWQHVIKVFFL